MVGRISRFVAALATAAILVVGVVSCASAPASGGAAAAPSGDVTYKCASCPKTKTAGPTAAAPS